MYVTFWRISPEVSVCITYLYYYRSCSWHTANDQGLRFKHRKRSSFASPPSNMFWSKIRASCFLKAYGPYRTKHGKTPSFSFVFADASVVQVCDWTETGGQAMPFIPWSPARSYRDSSVDCMGLISARSSYEKVVFTRFSSQRDHVFLWQAARPLFSYWCWK